MTTAEAAAIMRGKKGASMRNIFESERMGAEALEFQAWLFSSTPGGWLRVGLLLKKWHGENEFIDYCKEAWRKETVNG